MTEQDKKIGVLSAVIAYLIWGFAPMYFKQLLAVPALEILVHRIIWSILVLAILIVVLKLSRKLISVMANKKILSILALSSGLLAFNWFLFIWAVNNNKMLEASLGYYINPLLNMLLGFVFLRERLENLQKLSVLLALIGVLFLIISVGKFPWVALALASSFSIYGLLRKLIAVDSISGLFIESLLMAPLAIFYWMFFASDASNMIDNSTELNLLLLSAGVVTTAPLLFFTIAARRIKYSTLGFVQFIAPSIMFLLAIVVYKEPLESSRLVTFSFVWSGLILFVYSVLNRNRNAIN